MAPLPVAESLATMPSGTHAVLVYDSAENKRQVLFNHLSLGAGKEGLVYACSEESPTAIREEMTGYGIDVNALQASHKLSILDYRDVYIVNGKVDAPKIIEGFSTLAWDFHNKGMDGIRAAAEMSCFFKERKVSELMRYENALHKQFPFPGKGICAYNLVELGNSGNLELIWPILRAHGLVMMTGPNGSFALEPEKVNREDVRERTGLSL